MDIKYNDTELDIRNLTDDELANKFMFSDRDRKHDCDAERVYWLCVREINNRI